MQARHTATRHRRVTAEPSVLRAVVYDLGLDSESSASVVTFTVRSTRAYHTQGRMDDHRRQARGPRAGTTAPSVVAQHDPPQPPEPQPPAPQPQTPVSSANDPQRVPELEPRSMPSQERSAAFATPGKAASADSITTVGRTGSTTRPAAQRPPIPDSPDSPELVARPSSQARNLSISVPRVLIGLAHQTSLAFHFIALHAKDAAIPFLLRTKRAMYSRGRKVTELTAEANDTSAALRDHAAVALPALRDAAMALRITSQNLERKHSFGKPP